MYRLSGSDYYTDIPQGLFFTNWVFQKVWKVNDDVPYSVHYTSLISGSSNIHFPAGDKAIRKSFAVSGGCYFGIAEGSRLEIGEGTIWAWNVNIQTANHDLIHRDQFRVQDIKIGKNCWLGGNVTILPGVELGDGVTVGANSVVTKSFPAGVVIAGVPARIIRDLKQSNPSGGTV
ncbi:MAG TPA: DapH/DapD/GlmU-related protein [Chitinophagaceae bacterium]|nr:DapH/DapD/GlmU-related protein [Chitinophagaceae bacterium]